MTTMVRILLTAALFGLGLALAQTAPSEGACPNGFHLHDASEGHEHGDHGHRHVGTAVDRNGDGWICVEHVSKDGSIHVHIDNLMTR